MAATLNSKTSIEDLQQVVHQFDRKYPNAFDDEAALFILKSGKYKPSMIGNGILVALAIFIASLFLHDTSDQGGENFISLFVVAFVCYKIWRIYSVWREKAAGERALEQCVETAGIAEDDLDRFRQACKLIQSCRDRRQRGNDIGFGGSHSVTVGGCGVSGCASGSSGCGGGGGGCGGGGGGSD